MEDYGLGEFNVDTTDEDFKKNLISTIDDSILRKVEIRKNPIKHKHDLYVDSSEN